MNAIFVILVFNIVILARIKVIVMYAVIVRNKNFTFLLKFIIYYINNFNKFFINKILK